MNGKLWDLVPVWAVLVVQYLCTYGGEINVSIVIERNCKIEDVSISILYWLCFSVPYGSIYLEFCFVNIFLYVITLFDIFHYVTLVHSVMPYHYSLLYGICIIVYTSVCIIKINYTIMYITSASIAYL